MTSDGMALLLPVVVALHNAEEFALYGRFPGACQPRLPAPLTTRAVVGGAMILVTVAAAVLAWAAYHAEDGYAHTAVRVAVFALLWNALGHGLLSLRRRTLLPGTVTALLVVLPYAIASVLGIEAHAGAPAKQLLSLGLAGAAALPAIVLVAIGLSYSVLQLARQLARQVVR